MKDLQTDNPDPHVANVLAELEVLIDHLQRDVDKVSDDKAAVLFQTSADVLTGIKNAFEHYESARK